MSVGSIRGEQREFNKLMKREGRKSGSVKWCVESAFIAEVVRSIYNG